MTVPDHTFEPLKISLASNGASTHGRAIAGHQKFRVATNIDVYL